MMLVFWVRLLVSLFVKKTAILALIVGYYNRSFHRKENPDKCQG